MKRAMGTHSLSIVRLIGVSYHFVVDMGGCRSGRCSGGQRVNFAQLEEESLACVCTDHQSRAREDYIDN